MKVDAFSSLVSIKETAYDTTRDATGKLHPEKKGFPKEECFYMTQSPLKVCNFDTFAASYTHNKFNKENGMSVDALYRRDSDNAYVLIEFKNGNLEKERDIDIDLRIKLLNSLLILIDSENFQDYDFIRENVSFVLVYNPANLMNIENKSNIVSFSKSPMGAFSTFKKHYSRMCNNVPILFDLRKTYAGYLFKDVNTYDLEQFDELFIKRFAHSS